MSRKNPLHDYARYSTMAFQMMAIIAGGIFGGYELDKYLHFKIPLFTILFSFLSVAFAIYFVIKDLLKK